VIGRRKDLLGRKPNGDPTRPADRLITSHDTRPAASTSSGNDARIDAAVEAAVDTVALSTPATPAAPVAPAPRAPVEPVHRTAPDAPSAPGAPPAPGASDPWLADAFDLLLAEEQGEAPATLYGGTYGLSEADLDRIAVRVVDRLTRGQMGDAFTRIVTDVSERLVREEIARIRGSAAPPASGGGDQQ
jgi:hypothetical protein